MNRTCGTMNHSARMTRGNYMNCNNLNSNNLNSNTMNNQHTAGHRMDQKQLLCYIDEVSFAVYETLLYLDTHPDDLDALAFFEKHNQLREHALKEYSKYYGPLTISTACECAGKCWEWMNQPWPWEGGDC